MDRAHANQLVDIVDEAGAVVGQKLRKEIDKSTDIYHGVHVLLITLAKDLVLSRIPARTDLPNLYSGRLGTTVATIRRHREIAVAAASRALAEEIHCESPQPVYLGERFLLLAGGRRTYTSAYYLTGEPPTTFSSLDIDGFTLMTAAELNELMVVRPDQFAPTLVAIWSQYRDRLPV